HKPGLITSASETADNIVAGGGAGGSDPRFVPRPTIQCAYSKGQCAVRQDGAASAGINGRPARGPLRRKTMALHVLNNGDDIANFGSTTDSVFGLNGSDYISAGGGNDLVSGDAGNDTISGGDGLDRLDGGDGVDTVLYSSAPGGNYGSGVVVSLADGF